jgi:hypothetical protein
VAVGTAAQLVLVLLRVADYPGCAYLRKHNRCVELKFSLQVVSAHRIIIIIIIISIAASNTMHCKRCSESTNPFAQVHAAAQIGVPSPGIAPKIG